MDLKNLTDLFMWCTLINGGLLLFWVVACMLAPELVYRTQSRFFPMSRENFNLAMYAFLGLFKIFFLVFNLVPFLALLIVG